MKGALLLNVVVRKSAPIFQLLPSENQALLIRRNSLLVLNLLLHVLNGIGRLNIQSDSLAGQGLHKDLHATTEAEHQMKGALLLNVVVRKSAPIFQLLPSENQALLIRRNSLLVLNL